MEHRAVRFSILLCLAVLVFSQPSIARALSAPQKQVFDSGIHYFNVTEACNGSSNGAAPGNDKAYLLGDSLMAGAYYETKFLKTDFTNNGWNATVDASVGRSITAGGSDPSNHRPGHEQSGLDAIDTDAPQIKVAGTIVIELGTNTSGNASQYGDQIKQLIQKIKGLNTTAKLYWVNIVSTSDSKYPAYNDKINELAGDQGYTVIDAKSKGIELGAGNLHPTTNGYKDYAQAISDGMGSPISADGVQPGANSCCSQTGVGVSGSISPGVGKGMSDSVKQRFQQIMVAAGEKYNVDPNFVATFYYIEDGLKGGDSTNNADSAKPPPRTGDGDWLEPPPPYGHGPPYPPPNSFSATGPFQFINSTWAAYGVDGNGDGRVDVRDLTDAAFAAAKYLAASGAKNTTDEASLRRAAFSYNHSTDYGNSAINTFKYLTGQGASTVTGSANCAGGDVSGYQFPYRDVKNLVGMRIDEGVDYGGDGPIYAIGNGTVKIVSTSSGWPGGTFINYQLDDGPAKGKYVFLAENCTDIKVRVGDPVTSSTELCTTHFASPYTETGWGTDPKKGTIAAAYDVYIEGYPTAYGVNFNDFMRSLGDKTRHEKQQTKILGSLPAGWPSW